MLIFILNILNAQPFVSGFPYYGLLPSNQTWKRIELKKLELHFWNFARGIFNQLSFAETPCTSCDGSVHGASTNLTWHFANLEISRFLCITFGSVCFKINCLSGAFWPNIFLLKKYENLVWIFIQTCHREALLKYPNKLV